MNAKRKTHLTVEKSPLRTQLIVIQALVFVLPALVLAYLYYQGRIRLETSQLFFVGAIMVLVFSGLVILRQVFDRILHLNNTIQNAASSGEVYAEIHKDAGELHVITQNFNNLMKHFEAANKDLQRRVFELFSIRELTEMASKSLNIRELLKLLLEKAMSVTQVASGGIYMVDPADRKLRLVAAEGDSMPKPAAGEAEAATPYPLMRVMREKRPVLEAVDTGGQGQPDAMVYVWFMPIFIREQIVAIMYLHPWEGASDQGSNNEQILSIMIGEIGFALENAMLHTRLERHTEQLQKRTDELSAANEELKQTRLKLQNANEWLEERVLERTAKMEQANQELLNEISERKRIQKELEGAKEAAEAANVAKSRFLANMSHELRTPLNAIIGFSDIMLNDASCELGEKHRKYMDNIHSSGAQLLSLLETVLNMSRIESGTAELELSRFNPTEVIEEAVSMVQPSLEQKHLRITTELEEPLPLMQADRGKVKQIIYHLLSNAVKFTPPDGRVGLTARLTTVAIDGGEAAEALQFDISDTGIGLDMNEWDRILRPFEQGDTSNTRMFDGAGIGLTMTKKLLDLHGGSISADSKGENQGSTFRVILPVETRTPEQR